MKSYKNRVIDKNKLIQIYRNLNKKGVIYSVRQSGKVVAHTNTIVIKNCHFKINEGGKQRYLETGRKNVHAYIEGYLATIQEIELVVSYQIKYNIKSETGFRILFSDIKSCKIVYTQNNKLFCQI